MHTNAIAGSRNISTRNRLRDLDLRYLIVPLLVAIGILSVSAVTVLVLGNCHREPDVELESATIRHMAVFPIVNATNATSWQVASDINLTLSFRNRNSVKGCFTTPREIKVTAYYANSSKISVSQIPLTNFTLKPKRSRVVSAQLNTERFQMKNESAGAALAADLRSDNQTIPLKVEINTRYLIPDRRSFWTHSLCEMVARTPLRSNPALDDFFCSRSRMRENLHDCSGPSRLARRLCRMRQKN